LRASRFDTDFHPGRRLAQAGGGQHALAFDLDHAGAAVAVGPVAGRGGIAEMRDVDAVALGGLPDGLAVARLDVGAVDRELDRAHRVIPTSEGKCFMTEVMEL